MISLRHTKKTNKKKCQKVKKEKSVKMNVTRRNAAASGLAYFNTCTGAGGADGALAGRRRPRDRRRAKFAKEVAGRFGGFTPPTALGAPRHARSTCRGRAFANARHRALNNVSFSRDFFFVCLFFFTFSRARQRPKKEEQRARINRVSRCILPPPSQPSVNLFHKNFFSKSRSTRFANGAHLCVERESSLHTQFVPTL